MMASLDRPSNQEEILQLKDQVATLEELLQVYEQTATEQERRLQTALASLQERARQLAHAQETLGTLETILDSMGDAVVVVDVDGRHLFSNPAAQTLFNGQDYVTYFNQSSRNHNVCEANGNDFISQAQLPLSRAIQGSSLDAVEILITDENTRTHQWLSVNARPLYSMKQIVGGVAVFRDITLQKQVERALHKSNEEALQQTLLAEQTLQQLRQTQARLIHEEKMASLGKIVAGIAHEINNPVSFIQGNLNHAQQTFRDLLRLIHKFQMAYPNPSADIVNEITAIDLDFLAEDIPKLLRSMETGTERICDIVQSLRTFSRLDEAVFKAVDIHAGIDSTLAVLQAQLKTQSSRSAINVVKNYGSLPLVECQASQLNQVFNHLLSNAIDALDADIDEPTITISTTVNDESIEIHISDNGTGIPQTIKEHIFDPFFTTKPVGEGTGLGLYICYQIIVDNHHGQLICHSQQGQGTAVMVTLPLQPN